LSYDHYSCWVPAGADRTAGNKKADEMKTLKELTTSAYSSSRLPE